MYSDSNSLKTLGFQTFSSAIFNKKFLVPTGRPVILFLETCILSHKRSQCVARSLYQERRSIDFIIYHAVSPRAISLRTGSRCQGISNGISLQRISFHAGFTHQFSRKLQYIDSSSRSIQSPVIPIQEHISYI